MSLLALLFDVLFIGHSLIGPVLPGMVQTAARHQGVEMQAEAQIINGAPLRWSWDNSAQGQGVDARAVLPSGRFDAVVITEAIPLANHLQWNDTPGYARRFYDLAVQSRPDAQVFLYETWHSLDSGTGVSVAYDEQGAIPWRDRLDQDLPRWQGVVDAVNAARPPGAPPMRLVPAGQALGMLADEIAAGQVSGLDNIRQLFSDDIHLNDRGLYFVALVMHGAITGRDPRGLPPRLVRVWSSRNTVVTDAMAARMQAVAWRAVQAQTAREAARAGGASATAPGAPPPDDPVPQAAGVVQTRTAPADPAAVPAAAPGGGLRGGNVGFGLAAVTDWSVQQPFLDVFKTARPWIGHLPGQWGGWDHAALQAGGWLDRDGWPTGIPPELTGISTVLLTDLPEAARSMAGRYVLTHEGRGTLRLEGRVQNIRTAPGRIAFDFAPGEGSVILTITGIDADRPLRALRLVHEDREAALDAGMVFNPDWIERVRGARLVRFMDWMATNDSPLALLADRPRPGDYTWARIGVPVEVMVALANELRADPWFTLPHLAEDALVRAYAEAVAGGLDPGLRAYVEYSNEVWNFQFAQARWAEEQAKARWGQEWKWTQFYALRAAEVAAIWAEVFAPAPGRLVRVIATQTGWKGLEADMLAAPLAVAEGRAAPATGFDAYAVTGYFASQLGSDAKAPLVRRWLAESRAAAEAAAQAQGLTGAARESYVARNRFGLAVARAAEEMRDGRHSGDPGDSLAALLDDLLPYQAGVARAHGLDLVMYEGGTHAVGLGAQLSDAGLTEFLVHLNYSAEMGEIYRDLLAGWRRLSAAPFNAFTDVERPSQWGSWGALRHLDDDSPRWRALAEAQ